MAPLGLDRLSINTITKAPLLLYGLILKLSYKRTFRILKFLLIVSGVKLQGSLNIN